MAASSGDYPTSTPSFGSLRRLKPEKNGTALNHGRWSG